MKSKNVEFPLYGVIYNHKGLYEYNYLYTAQELQERDPELYNNCRNSNLLDWEDSSLSFAANKTIYGKRLDNSKELFAFITGKENELSDWTNSCEDVYRPGHILQTMSDAQRMYEESFEIHRTLTLSTGHISEETAKLLSNNTDEIDYLVFKNDSGFMISVTEDTEGDSIPDDIKKLMQLAKKCKCDMIHLDSDGPDMSAHGLTVYNW